MTYKKFKERESNYGKIYIYSLICLTKEVFLGLSLRYEEDKENFIDFLTITFSVMLEFTFIMDGIINRNIHQVENYPKILFCTISIASATFDRCKGISMAFLIAFIVLIVVEMAITWWWLNDLKLEFSSIYFSKFGLSPELQEINKLREQMMVYFKIDALNTVVSIYYPGETIPLGKALRYCKVATWITGLYIFITEFNSENIFLRIFLIGLYIFKFIIGILEIIEFSFNVEKALLFIPIITSYTMITDLLLIFTLYRDYKNFGKGLKKALYVDTRNLKTSVLE